MKTSMLLVFAGFCTTGAQADDGPTAQAIAMNCRSCHQPGDGESEIADLTHLARDELRQSLLDLKYNPKPGTTIMPRLIKGYSDRQLQAVADYLTER